MPIYEDLCTGKVPFDWPLLHVMISPLRNIAQQFDHTCKMAQNGCSQFPSEETCTFPDKVTIPTQFLNHKLPDKCCMTSALITGGRIGYGNQYKERIVINWTKTFEASNPWIISGCLNER